MAKFRPAYPTIVSTDVSSFSLGAVLLQMQPAGNRRLVPFASHSWTAAEQRYSRTEKVALAAVWAIRRFDEFL